MHPTPADDSPAKRSRTKSKATAAKPARSRRKSAAAEPVQVLAMHPVVPNADELNGMIATAAYYLAAQRHFAAGHELDDWLLAEKQVRGQLGVD